MASGLVVLDTSVVSLFMRGHGTADYYRGEIEGLRAVISFQTLEESWFGALKNNWGEERRNLLGLHLAQFDVVWPNLELVHIAAGLRAERERAGRRLSTADAWIAATAILLGCPLVSHDKDFSGISNLEVIRAP